MGIIDFSNGFDTLASSYAVSAGYGNQDRLAFDEYEKSVFLTQSQEEVVLGIYTGRNVTGFGFEETEEMRRYLEKLVETDELDIPLTDSEGNPYKISEDSYLFQLPPINAEDTHKPVWFIVYEKVTVKRHSADAKSTVTSNAGETTVNGNKCSETFEMEVVPVRHDEYNKLRKNPFRGANDRRALRLDLSDGVVEIVCKHEVEAYHLRYLRKPYPIILETLPEGMKIEGENTPFDTDNCCELHEALHQRILEMAVMKALQSKGISISSATGKDTKENN